MQIRHEARHGDYTEGGYAFLQPDGLWRIVTYIVDSYGYHPTISYVRPEDLTSDFMLRHTSAFGILGDDGSEEHDTNNEDDHMIMAIS